MKAAAGSHQLSPGKAARASRQRPAFGAVWACLLQQRPPHYASPGGRPAATPPLLARMRPARRPKLRAAPTRCQAHPPALQKWGQRAGRAGAACPSTTAPAARARRHQERRAGGRAKPLANRTSGQGALARGGHNFCGEDIGGHVPLRSGLRFPKAPVGRARPPVLGAPVAAEAHWLPMRRSRNCPTRPRGERQSALALSFGQGHSTL